MDLIPHRQQAVVADPGDGASTLQLALVSPELTTVLRRRSLAAALMWADQIESLMPEPAIAWSAVIDEASNQWCRAILDTHLRCKIFDRRDPCKRVFSQEPTRGAAYHTKTLAINQKDPLGPLPTLGFPEAIPPTFRAKEGRVHADFAPVQQLLGVDLVQKRRPDRVTHTWQGLFVPASPPGWWRRELAGKILPAGSRLKHPQDASRHCCSFEGECQPRDERGRRGNSGWITPIAHP